jgi:hypothetical protein
MPREEHVYGSEAEIRSRATRPKLFTEFLPQNNAPTMRQAPAEPAKKFGVIDAPISGRSIQQQSEAAMLAAVVPKSKAKAKVIPPIAGK